MPTPPTRILLYLKFGFLSLEGSKEGREEVEEEKQERVPMFAIWSFLQLQPKYHIIEQRPSFFGLDLFINIIMIRRKVLVLLTSHFAVQLYHNDPVHFQLGLPSFRLSSLSYSSCCECGISICPISNRNTACIALLHFI